MTCNCCQSNRISNHFIGKKKMYKCRNCGLFFQRANASGGTNKKMIEHYQKDDPHLNVAVSKVGFFNSALEYLSSRIENNDRTLLDIGCGFGYFLRIAAKKGWQTFGVDITPRAAYQAASQAKDSHGKITVYLGTLQEAKYTANFFDAVTLWDVLFSVNDPCDELKESYRIMKPGATIGIRVRNAFFQRLTLALLFFFENILARFGVKPPYVFHAYSFSVSALQSLLLRLGYTNIQISNALLTEGDPYNYAGSKNFVIFVKHVVMLLCEFIYIVSRKKLIVGPSLMVWAEKPRSDLK